MTDFNTWRKTGRAFTPAYAAETFGWKPIEPEVSKVFVYGGIVFIEILTDGTPVFGGVAMGDHQMAEEAAFQWLRASRVA